MSHDPTSDSAANRSAGQIVHALLQFLRIVRYRKGVVLACVGISVLLGGLYYATATRYYESTAGIFVMQTGNDVLRSTRITPEGARIGLMPTYERILQGSEVLEAAIRHLPRKYCLDFDQAPPEKQADRLARNLHVKTVRHSNVIEVSYRSRDPEAAAAVVQAIVDAYLQYMRRTNQNAAGQILTILREELTDVDQRLAAKGNEVLLVRQQMANLGLNQENDPHHPLVTKVIELNKSRLEVQKMRLEMDAKLAAIRADHQQGRDLKQYVLALADQLGQDILSVTLGVDRHNAAMLATVQDSLLEDEALLRRLLAEGLGHAHPRVTSVQHGIAARRQFLANYHNQVRDKLDQVHQEQLAPMLIDFVEQRRGELLRNEATLDAHFTEARAQAMQLVGQMGWLEILQRDEKYLLQTRENLWAKISEIDLTQSHGNIRTEMTDTPEVVAAPVSPNLMLTALFSVVFGLAIGVASVCVQDALDDRFRSPEELETQLQLPILAMVRQLTLPAESGPDALQMHVAPDAAQSESFRTLRTALAFHQHQTDRLVVCSTDPGDGKTTVLANLAVAFARTGKKTLLVDADMRRPGLSRLLQLQTKQGLTQLLQGEESVETLAPALVRTSGVEQVDVLPSGPRQANPAELLAGPRLAELLAWAEAQYDQVLVDAPPATAATDASIIAGLCDGLLLVVRPDKNRRQAVQRAITGFRSIGIRPLGLIVNGIGADAAGGYYAYAENYAYGEGYGEDPADPPQEAESEDPERPSLAAAIQVAAAAQTVDPDTRGHDGEDPPQAGPMVPRRAA